MNLAKLMVYERVHKLKRAKILYILAAIKNGGGRVSWSPIPILDVIWCDPTAVVQGHDLLRLFPCVWNVAVYLGGIAKGHEFLQLLLQKVMNLYICCYTNSSGVGQ